jgi:hypothetical protein
VNDRYKAAKQRSKEALASAEALVTIRDPDIIEESDRIIKLREAYFRPLAKWEDALAEVGGDVEELQRQGIDKPEPPEDTEDGDLRSLEELEIACTTVQEQLEYNNNRDESVVRSYEEKKRLVSDHDCLWRSSELMLGLD